MKNMTAGTGGIFSVLAAALLLPAVPGHADGVPEDFSGFEKSAAAGGAPPAGLSEPLKALWHAKAGDWDEAHDIAQKIKTPAGSWIHALLHREEGDDGNAAFWYRRAGKTMPKGFSIAEEWSFIARELWHGEHGASPGDEVFTSATGYVATTRPSPSGEEGAWDTLIRKDGAEIGLIPNARPVSFHPDGSVLLLFEAAADDSLEHFLIRPEAAAKVPPFGERKRVGGRFITGHEWAEDGKNLTLIPMEGMGDKVAVAVAEYFGGE